jgi:Predicted hydrolase of the alpha/beta superfamily
MILTKAYNGMTFDIVRASSQRICYILLPEGLKEEGRAWMEDSASRFGTTVVVMSGMNWNDDLTPWSAEGVFKKAKPFGGNAEVFFANLTDTILPWLDKELSLDNPERYLFGISLSGLFAIWSCFKDSLMSGVASISGSMWFNGFSEWVKNQTPSPSVKKIYISLVDREKRAKDKRMATVEDATLSVVESMKEKGASVEFNLEKDTTHFSPLIPRLERALAAFFE